MLIIDVLKNEIFFFRVTAKFGQHGLGLALGNSFFHSVDADLQFSEELGNLISGTEIERAGRNWMSVYLFSPLRGTGHERTKTIVELNAGLKFVSKLFLFLFSIDMFDNREARMRNA